MRSAKLRVSVPFRQVTRTADAVHRLGAVRRLSWAVRSILIGGGILVLLWNWEVGTLSMRVVRDSVLFLFVPGLIASVHGRHIGWHINRIAVRNTVLFSAFVFPVYILGSTLPSIRSFYPMWTTSPVLGDFLPHALQLFVLALATETYFRGFLCVGVRELGRKCVLISPVVYVLIHTHKPPIELVLSGPTDVLFGTVDYYSNSILPSVVAHGGGLILLDWLVLHDPVLSPAILLRIGAWFSIPL